MAGSDKKSRLFRRIFKLPDLSKDRPSANEGQETLEISTELKSGGIASSPKSTIDGDGMSVKDGRPCLWGEVYNSFISTATPELQAIAERLRDQCKPPEPLATSDHDREACVSPRWQLCNDILRMTKSQKDNAESGGATTLKQRVSRAYNGIMAWTQKIVALGDVVSQVDPVHIGLPWAVIRAVLFVCRLKSI